MNNLKHFYEALLSGVNHHTLTATLSLSLTTHICCWCWCAAGHSEKSIIYKRKLHEARTQTPQYDMQNHIYTIRSIICFIHIITTKHRTYVRRIGWGKEAAWPSFTEACSNTHIPGAAQGLYKLCASRSRTRSNFIVFDKVFANAGRDTRY